MGFLGTWSQGRNKRGSVTNNTVIQGQVLPGEVFFFFLTEETFQMANSPRHFPGYWKPNHNPIGPFANVFR